MEMNKKVKIEVGGFPEDSMKPVDVLSVAFVDAACKIFLINLVDSIKEHIPGENFEAVSEIIARNMKVDFALDIELMITRDELVELIRNATA